MNTKRVQRCSFMFLISQWLLIEVFRPADWNPSRLKAWSIKGAEGSINATLEAESKLGFSNTRKTFSSAVLF